MLPAMPTVLANVLLSLLGEKSYAVRSDDSVCVVSPMYNEEKGAARSLASLLAQQSRPEEIVLSINGGTDATYEVVGRTLRGYGYRRLAREAGRVPGAAVESWRGQSATPVTVVTYRWQIGKADSINNLVMHDIVTSRRLVVLDGDTVLHPAFVRELRDDFYRLRAVRDRQGLRFVIEDYGMQSGVVTSFAPRGASPAQRFISLGREAEYAFGQVLKDGQTRSVARASGSGGPWSGSRLYTVVGCGFAVRRDLLPIPWDTRTEDHDLTLASQNRPATRRSFTPAELTARGLRVVVDGVEGPLDLVMDKHDRVELVQAGHARQAGRALMKTEDPPHLSGFLGQLERWNGGSQQNILKRLGAPLGANVAYVLWSSLLENLLGIMLLAAVPVGLAVHWGNPSLGIAPGAILLGFGIDVLAMTLIVICGLYRYRRAEGKSRAGALALALGRGLLSILPFTVLRYMNPLAYLASATVVLPHYVKGLRERGAKLRDSSWRRPAQRQRSRTQSVFVLSLVVLPLVMASSAWIASGARPINREAWRLIYQTGKLVDIARFVEPKAAGEQSRAVEADIGALLMRRVSAGLAQLVPARAARTAPNAENQSLIHPALSAYCDPSSTVNISSAGASPAGAALGGYGDAAAYRPLGRGRLLVLARFAPLAGLLANAARAYGVPQDLLLEVLLNESYLDPLAVGPTGDRGLSQMTAESLTMLRALSRSGKYANAALFGSGFSVFDPDFSICAGAAKLAWAMDQPGVDGPQEAYALYINPIRGLVHGEISPEHRPLTANLERLAPMVEELANLAAQYARAPRRLTMAERELMDIASAAADGKLSLEEAYRQTFRVVREAGLPDQEMYRAVFGYFGEEVAAVP